MPHAARPLVIGHRGAPGYRPEHTRSSYELAFALGADAVEPDLVATRDGVLVLRHENEISGTTDIREHPEFSDRHRTQVIDGEPLSGWFTEDFTWAELSTLRARERVPELRRSSATFDGRFPLLRLADLIEIVERASDDQARLLGLVAEFKHASHFASIGLPLDELFAAELSAAGWGRGGDRLVMEAFELDVLDGLRDRGIHGERVFLVEASGAPADQVAKLGATAATYDSYASEAGLLGLAGRVDGVSVDKGRILGRRPKADAPGPVPLTGATFVDAAHSAALSVYTWTLRPENRFLAARRRDGRVPGRWGDWLGEYRQIMSTGLDGVFADHPDLAVEARRSLEDEPADD
ncbi:glycerophosphodiester phosphodiesterase family protein [Agromyces seonyuensis]|uniref:glycerophosphodiester phosphodiesterase n=1 Tax=Agromyces seonyuensis TaxID=2662446 RepID=A0A6I4NXL3_9MICO|nr:glycerophosphodiester phosphodiesterase family protein [Agromyces seonyuensis]MWB98921.1 glycerophosphodiester phosphodiesterase [Agromyces seonyuensis]